jgi:hypothetical protein
MKKFFNSMEERFVFPIGRRSWQILSLLGLILLTLSILYFVVNSTPTSRESVSVSKAEVIGDKVDTTATVVETTPATCSDQDYKNWLDTLKKDLTNSEWVKLGDSTEPYTEYAKDEYGSYIQDSEGNFLTYQKRDFKPNTAAIPNVLELIYNSKGLDSSSYCEKIEVVKLLHFLNQKTEKNYLEKEGVFYYASGISELPAANMIILEKSFTLKAAIELSDKKISSLEELNEAWRYIRYLSTNSVSDKHVDIAISTIKAHSELKKKEYPSNKYFDIAELVFNSNLKIEDLSTAMEDFNEEISFYDSNDLYKSLRKFLKLYEEKVERAEAKKEMKSIEKSLHRTQSLTYAAGAFLAIVAIASILLLFSIQSLLKNHVGNKPE